MKLFLNLMILSSISMASWQTQNVAIIDGSYVSLAKDDSGLFISHCGVGINLSYTISTGWATFGLQSEGDNYYTSVAASGSQDVHVAWSNNFELKYSDYSRAGQVLDTSCHSNTSIALYDNGFPAIAYYGDTDVKFISWDGSDWNGEVIDPECGCSTVALAINNSNQPLIAYSSNNGFLRIAQWDGSQWDITTIDSGSDFFSDGIGLALDSSGNPHIASRRNYDLYYYYYDGSDWSSEAIDTGLFSSLASASITVDNSGNPHIAYNAIDGSTSTIIYLHNDGSEWTREELEPGTCPSIIIDSYGDPGIAFSDNEDGVKYLCHNTMSAFGDPVASSLLQGISPNPASTSASLDIALAVPGNVAVTVCDLSGRVVEQLEFKDLPHGARTLELDLTAVPSGMYICRVATNEGSAASRLTVLR